jgi:hypothetical protein
MKIVLASLLLVFLNLTIHAQSIYALKSNMAIKDKLKNEILLAPNSKELKSPTLAFLFSFLVPGVGELYANRYDVGVYFTAVEGTLWLGLSGLNYYGNWQRDNYKEYASVHAGVDLQGKDETYFATISSYLNINDYNNEKYLNREFNKVLDLKTHYWNWPSNDYRKRYRSIWTSSESAFNNIRFAAAMIVVNHLVSAINAAILVNKFNKNLNEDNFSIQTGLGTNIFGDLNYNIYLTARF